MRDRLLKQALRERFLITLTTGEAFDGLLNEHDGDTMTFVDAHAVSAVQGQVQHVPVDGELYLPRSKVAYMQKLPA